MEERTADETRVVCVWGSPLSGKTTYVEKHAKKSDVIWDWDKVKQAVSMTGSHQETEPQTHKMLMRLRASFMRSASDCGAQTAWFICTRPDVFIREMLGSDAEYIKMDVSKEECLRRLEKDDTRPDKQKMADLIEKFFREEGTEERFREDQARDERGRFVDVGGSFGDIDGTFKTGGIVRLPDGTSQPRLYSNGGKKARDIEVMDLATGEKFRLADGAKLQDVEVFAGKGTKTPFRNAEKAAEKFGGEAKDWQHVKGFCTLDTPDGDRDVEIHWIQCQGFGKHDFFIKRWLD